MSAEQLCFFKFARTLEDRLGPAFFKSVPRQAGVYLFRDCRQKVLYVGQSQNLRVRLAYYKNAQPEREPAKIIRLVHRTERIDYELCVSPAEAEFRELELIQLHRPSFNVANARSVIYSFIEVQAARQAISLSLHLQPRTSSPCFGAFKSRGLCRKALFSLGRLLWSAENDPASILSVPLGLIDCPANSVELSMHSAELYSALSSFLRGDSPYLLDILQLQINKTVEPFTRTFLEQDHLLLSEFFERGPKRNKSLQSLYGAPDLIPKEQLDRLLLTMRKCKQNRAMLMDPVSELSD